MENAVVADLELARELRLEAEAIEASNGPNPYSDYLRKHGQRPPREEASAIGRLLGGRVRARDGSMQPQLTKAEKAAIKEIKASRKLWHRRYEQALQLKWAIDGLSRN